MFLEIGAGIGSEFRRGTPHRSQLFRWGQPIGAGFDDAGTDLLLKARDAHHEKFVQVGANDGQEFDPFQQRIAEVLSFFQDASEEFQLAQFAVNEELGIIQCRINFEVLQQIFELTHDGPPAN